MLVLGFAVLTAALAAKKAGVLINAVVTQIAGWYLLQAYAEGDS